MTDRLHHEEIYRGAAAMKKLAATSVHICGAGALGSNLTVNLARCGIGRLTVIDKDRVEEHNISTQIYSLEDVGARKADLLRNLIYREVGIELGIHADELTEKNVGKLLRGAELVVDTFDNSKSRQIVTDYCRSNQLPCIHAGVNDEYGEVRWNDRYCVPSDVGLDVCDYPLGRNLILLVATVTSEVLIRYIVSGVKEEYTATLGDFAINRVGQ